MRIYLLGYMGSGKSTLGKELAQELCYNFIDLDNLIELKQKKSVYNIFTEQGESSFRKLEKDALHSTFAYENTVISLGGGTPCFYDNMEQVNKSGVSIYIDTPVKALFLRLKKVKSKRPLIANKTDDELLLFIEKSLLERELFYKKAKVIVSGISITAELLGRTIEKYQ